jgi:hypothetical protein
VDQVETEEMVDRVRWVKGMVNPQEEPIMEAEVVAVRAVEQMLEAVETVDRVETLQQAQVLAQQAATVPLEIREARAQMET